MGIEGAGAEVGPEDKGRSPRGLLAARLSAFGLGAAAMYWLDPAQGRRRRARARDRLVRALHRIDDAIGVASRALARRAGGPWAGEARSLPTPARLAGEELVDDLLVGRVRSELGRLVPEPDSVSVTAYQGRVILRGPIAAPEADRVLGAVAALPGVAAVEEHLAPRREREPDWAGEPPELWQVNWPPSARALAGVAGVTLILGGARRGGLLGLALGAAGAGLLGRGVANIPLHHLLGMGDRQGGGGK